MCSRHPYLKSRVLRLFVTGCFTYHENKALWYCSIYWKELQESRHNIQPHFLSKISYSFSLLKLAGVGTKHNNIFLVGSVTVLVRTTTVRIEQNEDHNKKWIKEVHYSKTLHQLYRNNTSKFETIFDARELYEAVVLFQREDLQTKHGVPNPMKLSTYLRSMTTFISVHHNRLNKP